MRNDADKRELEKRFTQYYSDWREAIFRFCLAKLSGDTQSAEDCMQNAFVVLYKSMLAGEEIEYPRAFLYKVAGRYAFKVIENKKRNSRNIITLSDEYEPPVDIQEEVDRAIDIELLSRKLETCLTDDEMALIKMRYEDELTIQETAERLSISPYAAAKRLQRLREKIKACINFEERSCN